MLEIHQILIFLNGNKQLIFTNFVLLTREISYDVTPHKLLRDADYRFIRSRRTAETLSGSEQDKDAGAHLLNAQYAPPGGESA